MLWNKIEEPWQQLLKLSWERYQANEDVNVLIVMHNDELVCSSKTSQHLLKSSILADSYFKTLYELSLNKLISYPNCELYASLPFTHFQLEAIKRLGIEDYEYACGLEAILKDDKTTSNIGYFQLILIISQLLKLKKRQSIEIIQTYLSSNHPIVLFTKELNEQAYFESAQAKQIPINYLFQNIIESYYSYIEVKKG